MKLCKDCKHHDLPWGTGTNLCRHPKLYEVSLVTGELSSKLGMSITCDHQRMQDEFIIFMNKLCRCPEYCGVKGHWFEPKEKKES